VRQPRITVQPAAARASTPPTRSRRLGQLRLEHPPV
jgi:hypothetical protein